MKTRTLGRGPNALTVPTLGLGCMGMSEFYGVASDAESIATIHRALDLQDIVPIPGTTDRKHLEENLAAAEIALSAEDLQRIDAVAPKGAAAGARYQEAGMANVNV